MNSGVLDSDSELLKRRFRTFSRSGLRPGPGQDLDQDQVRTRSRSGLRPGPGQDLDQVQEALRRIIVTLTNKNQELRDLLQTLDRTRTGLQVRPWTGPGPDYRTGGGARTAKLRPGGEGAELRAAIVQSQQQKEAELQAQQGAGQSALLDGEELLAFADSALSISDHAHFLQAAKEIKERVTMAPAFRLSSRPVLVSLNMSHFSVDFGAERAGLQALDFLPAPPVPVLDESRCSVSDNTLHAHWSCLGQSGASYELQYRKCEQATPL
ncbi:hypothetical protein WMY93_032371 [Mugilogobius chulae]|uniref:COS domain-containing protein n=1 Tax=Mugilogobius chulae TaxID=88201 RepID=A0AAW0MWX4_9GOBI